MSPWNTLSPERQVLAEAPAAADADEAADVPGTDERASLAAYRRARRRARNRRVGIGVLGLAVLVVIWEIAALIENDPVFLPSLTQTVASFAHYLTRPYPAQGSPLWLDTLTSLRRILLGFAAGTAIGVALGAGMSASTIVRHLVDPIIEVLRPLPPLAFIPLFIIWLGIGEAPKEALIMIGVAPVMAVTTVASLDEVPDDLRLCARALGASSRYTMLRVQIRSALPGIITGMRIAMAGAWTSIVAAELIAATSGLGYLISQAGEYLNTALVFSGIISIAIVGLILDACLRGLLLLADPSRRRLRPLFRVVLAGESQGMPSPVGRAREERDLDAVAGRVTADLLRQSHLMVPEGMADALARTAEPLGVLAARVYLADLQQRHLAPVPAGAGHDQDAQPLPIDSTLAGRAYQTLAIQSAPARGGTAAGYQVWIPLVDGTERLGVLGLTVADASEAMLDRYRGLASFAGITIASKAGYSDTYAQAQREREMALQAELVWAFLAPRTFATDQVLVAATLEPAYEAGGDAFDYTLHGDHLQVSIFDALGHDLQAGLLASVGIASCRSTRRSGGSLPDIVSSADSAIAGFFGEDRFVTALLCDLDLVTGLLTWIPCGHPPPLLIRGRSVRELARTAQPPLGLARLFARRARGPRDNTAGTPVCAERLEPGDRLLLYTDGVTEGRAVDGTAFGLDRLADFIIRHGSAGLPAPETMRRLNHSIIEYQRGKLRDDATAVLVEWHPPRPAQSLTP